jgi:hypothetical protein
MTGVIVLDPVLMAGKTTEGAIVTASMTVDGRLNIQNVVTTPPLTTPVVRLEKGNISTTTGTDNTYTIPSGVTLTIQRLSGGAETTNAGSIVELYEDPNGDLSTLNTIEDIYFNGGSGQKDLGVKYDGDGTRRIVLRRRNFGGGTNECTARWEGYYE